MSCNFLKENEDGGQGWDRVQVFSNTFSLD
jgi:hypothetical protein